MTECTFKCTSKAYPLRARATFNGFCILSAGIFRGGCPLKVVIQKGLETIAKHTYSGLETVVFCGFTPREEQAEVSDIAAPPSRIGVVTETVGESR